MIFKKIIIGLIGVGSSLNIYANKCVPAHEYFPMEKNAPRNDNGEIALGMYSRMSPDGRYILRSFSGNGISQVTLVELVRGEKNSVKIYETPFSNEAFPVQGSWRYLVDIGGQHYLLDDIKKFQKKAQRQFSGGIKGFYTVASELSGGTNDSHQIRSLSWPSEGGSDGVGEQGVGVLSNQLIKAKFTSDGKAQKIDSGKVNYMCANLKKTDGSMMSLPMMSPWGTEFASMPQDPKNGPPSMRIYSLQSNHKDCTLVQDLQMTVAKIIFSFPMESGSQINAALFYASGGLGAKGNGVAFFERISKKVFTLDDPDRKVRADSFPGFTRDGRIMYGAEWEECVDGACVGKTGYVISDPLQSEDVKQYKLSNLEAGKHLKECITEEDVLNTNML